MKSLVEKEFNQPQKCYGHCDREATLRFLQDEALTIAAYSCPSGYVSRLMAYAEKVDPSSFKMFLVKKLLGIDVRDEDIRTASRYSWDLGEKFGREGKVMTVAYWTQNYRRSKTDNPDRVAVYCCLRCGSLFTQRLTSQGTLCSSCAGS